MIDKFLYSSYVVKHIVPHYIPVDQSEKYIQLRQEKEDKENED